MFNNNTGNNIFGGNQNNQGNNQSNLFGKPNQNQPNSIFGAGQQQGAQNFGANRTQTNTGLFANQGGNNTQTNNLFGNNQPQGANTNTLFGNNQNRSTNLFNQGGNNNQGGATNNLFNQGGQGGNNSNNLFNQGGNTLYSNNQTGYNQTGTGYNMGYQNANSTVNEAKVYELLNAPAEQQKKLFEAFTPDYIKQLINHYRKCVEILKTEKFQLSADNPLRGQKINKVAGGLSIKPQIVQIKKLVRDNVTTKLKHLKNEKEAMEKLSVDFSMNVFKKLQKYKEKLVISVTQSKMIEEIKKEVEQLDNETKQFFIPLFNAHQNRTNFTFFDPSPFCVSVSEKLLRNMTLLDNRLDQILACQGEVTQDNIDTADVIVQLVEYYQNVAVTLKDYSAKYIDLKKKVLQKSRQSNADQAFRKLSDKANSIVKKDMEAYQIVKQIQSLLEKRQKKLSERSKQ